MRRIANDPRSIEAIEAKIARVMASIDSEPDVISPSASVGNTDTDMSPTITSTTAASGTNPFDEFDSLLANKPQETDPFDHAFMDSQTQGFGSAPAQFPVEATNTTSKVVDPFEGMNAAQPVGIDVLEPAAKSSTPSAEEAMQRPGEFGANFDDFGSKFDSFDQSFNMSDQVDMGNFNADDPFGMLEAHSTPVAQSNVADNMGAESDCIQPDLSAFVSSVASASAIDSNAKDLIITDEFETELSFPSNSSSPVQVSRDRRQTRGESVDFGTKYKSTPGNSVSNSLSVSPTTCTPKFNSPVQSPRREDPMVVDDTLSKPLNTDLFPAPKEKPARSIDLSQFGLGVGSDSKDSFIDLTQDSGSTSDALDCQGFHVAPEVAIDAAAAVITVPETQAREHEVKVSAKTTSTSKSPSQRNSFDTEPSLDYMLKQEERYSDASCSGSICSQSPRSCSSRDASPIRGDVLLQNRTDVLSEEPLLSYDAAKEVLGSCEDTSLQQEFSQNSLTAMDSAEEAALEQESNLLVTPSFHSEVNRYDLPTSADPEKETSFDGLQGMPDVLETAEHVEIMPGTKTGNDNGNTKSPSTNPNALTEALGITDSTRVAGEDRDFDLADDGFGGLDESMSQSRVDQYMQLAKSVDSWTTGASSTAGSNSAALGEFEAVQKLTIDAFSNQPVQSPPLSRTKSDSRTLKNSTPSKTPSKSSASSAQRTLDRRHSSSSMIPKKAAKKSSASVEETISKWSMNERRQGKITNPTHLLNGSPSSKTIKPSSPIIRNFAGPDTEQNVCVAVRVRPFSKAEKNVGGRTILSCREDSLVCVNPNVFDADLDAVAAAAAFAHAPEWSKSFRFDHCLWSASDSAQNGSRGPDDDTVDQEGVYRTIGCEIVEAVLNGISASCFAYGHTGTGKTYSLFGDIKVNKEADVDEVGIRYQLSESSGLIPRVLTDVVEGLARKDGDEDTRVTLSFMEVYNEKIRDLLAPASDKKEWNDSFATDTNAGASGSNLRVREHPCLGPYVQGLLKAEVETAEDVLSLIRNGSLQRTVGSNAFNPQSSRSHAIVILELSPRNLDLNAVATGKVAIPSLMKRDGLKASEQRHDSATDYFFVRLQMVDLAGSEREVTGRSDVDDRDAPKKVSSGSKKDYLSMSPHSAATQTASEKTELKLIRRSLSTLGYIIRALNTGAPFRTLPYRDSVLTWLMRDALNGRNHTTILATLSPSHTSYEENLNTLNYVQRLRKQTAITTSNPFELVDGGSMGASIGFGEYQRSDQGSLSSFSPTRSAITPVTTPGKSVTSPMSTKSATHKALMQRLGGGTPGSQAAKKLLQNVVSDPQQRLAKIGLGGSAGTQRASVDNSFSIMDSSSAATYGQNASQSVLLNSPPRMDALDAANDLSQASGDSQRDLQGQLVEMQIELHAAQTDRDSMLSELQAAKEALDTAQMGSSSSQVELSDLKTRLIQAENEIEDLRAVIVRKDATIDHLLTDLQEEQSAKIETEKAAEAQSGDFLDKAESIEQEKAQLLEQLDRAEVARKLALEDAKNANEVAEAASKSAREAISKVEPMKLALRELEEKIVDRETSSQVKSLKLEEAQTENDELRKQIFANDETMVEVGAKIEELIADKKAKEQKLSIEINTLKESIDAFPQERARYKELIDSMRTANVKLAEKIKTVQAAENTSKADLSKLEEEAGRTKELEESLAKVTKEKDSFAEKLMESSKAFLTAMDSASAGDQIDAEEVCALEEGLKSLVVRESLLNDGSHLRSKDEISRSNATTQVVENQLKDLRQTCRENSNLMQNLDKERYKVRQLEKKVHSLQSGSNEEQVGTLQRQLQEQQAKEASKDKLIEDLKMQLRLMENQPQFGVNSKSRMEDAALQQAYEEQIKTLLKQQDALKNQLSGIPSTTSDTLASSSGASGVDARARVIVSLGALNGSRHMTSFSSESGVNEPPNINVTQLQDQLGAVKKAAELSEARAVYWQKVAHKVRGMGENSKDVTDEITEALKSENADLKEQLQASQGEASKAKEELRQTQESMQTEFASLWMAVQELNKIDAQKEKAIAALVEDRDKAANEKENVERKLTALTKAYHELQRELKAIDNDLLEAADTENISITVGNKKIVPKSRSSSSSRADGATLSRVGTFHTLDSHDRTGPRMTTSQLHTSSRKTSPRGRRAMKSPRDRPQSTTAVPTLDPRAFATGRNGDRESDPYDNMGTHSPRPSWDNEFPYNVHSPPRSARGHSPPKERIQSPARSSGSRGSRGSRVISEKVPHLLGSETPNDVFDGTVRGTGVSSAIGVSGVNGVSGVMGGKGVNDSKTGLEASGAARTKKVQNLLTPFPTQVIDDDDASPLVESILQNQIAELSGFLENDRKKRNQRRQHPAA